MYIGQMEELNVNFKQEFGKALTKINNQNTRDMVFQPKFLYLSFLTGLESAQIANNAK